METVKPGIIHTGIGPDKVKTPLKKRVRGLV
jgi:hypothetical protein